MWLVAATHDLELQVTHIPGEQLTSSADALSRWHTAPVFQQRAQQYIDEHGLQLIDVPEEAFFVDSDL
jgi:hypothetical protein